MDTTPRTPAPAKPRTTFGSLFAAMLIGVALTIWGLYAWGSQVDAAQKAAAQEALP